MKGRASIKLAQAREFLVEADSLLESGADLPFVLNSIYYAMLYAVLALLYSRDISAPSQRDAVRLFDRTFISAGALPVSLLDSFRRCVELRPACSCEKPPAITKGDISLLLPAAKDLLSRAESLLG